jgi:hypothetical protein
VKRPLERGRFLFALTAAVEFSEGSKFEIGINFCYNYYRKKNKKEHLLIAKEKHK